MIHHLLLCINTSAALCENEVGTYDSSSFDFGYATSTYIFQTLNITPHLYYIPLFKQIAQYSIYCFSYWVHNKH